MDNVVVEAKDHDQVTITMSLEQADMLTCLLGFTSSHSPSTPTGFFIDTLYSQLEAITAPVARHRYDRELDFAAISFEQFAQPSIGDFIIAIKDVNGEYK